MKYVISIIIIENAFSSDSEDSILFSCKLLEGTITTTSVPLVILLNDKEVIIKIKNIESVSEDSSFVLEVEVVKQEIKIHELYKKEVLVTLLDDRLLHPRLRKNKT